LSCSSHIFQPSFDARFPTGRGNAESVLHDSYIMDSIQSEEFVAENTMDIDRAMAEHKVENLT